MPFRSLRGNLRREEDERAVVKLIKDRDELLAFYDFPAEHWKHIRTTNPIESVFADGQEQDTENQGMPEP